MQTNASHRLSCSFDLNIVKCLLRIFGDQWQERGPEFQVCRVKSGSWPCGQWGLAPSRASSLSWPTPKYAFIWKEGTVILSSVPTVHSSVTPILEECSLLTIFGGRDIDYHSLVRWPNFHLPYYHFHPELSFLYFSAVDHSPCLTWTSTANLTCCLCNMMLTSATWEVLLITGPSLTVGKVTSCLYVYLKLCWGLWLITAN